MNLTILAIVLALSPTPQEQFWGLLCTSVEAAESVAQANAEGGIALEDTVSDELVAENRCVRLGRLNAIFGYQIYNGRIIGSKQVIGISRSVDGMPDLFGLTNASGFN